MDLLPTFRSVSTVGFRRVALFFFRPFRRRRLSAGDVGSLVQSSAKKIEKKTKQQHVDRLTDRHDTTRRHSIKSCFVSCFFCSCCSCRRRRRRRRCCCCCRRFFRTKKKPKSNGRVEGESSDPSLSHSTASTKRLASSPLGPAGPGRNRRGRERKEAKRGEEKRRERRERERSEGKEEKIGNKSWEAKKI